MWCLPPLEFESLLAEAEAGADGDAMTDAVADGVGCSLGLVTASARSAAGGVVELGPGATRFPYTCEVRNTVLSCRLRRPIDARILSRVLPAWQDAQAMAKPFVMSVTNPRATLLAFSTGPLTVTGCPTFEDAVVALQRILAYIGAETRTYHDPYNVRPVNMYYRCDAGCNVDPARLAAETPGAKYMPETISYVTFRVSRSVGGAPLVCTANVFAAGMVSIMGVKSTEHAESVIPDIVAHVQAFAVGGARTRTESGERTDPVVPPSSPSSSGSGSMDPSELRSIQATRLRPGRRPRVAQRRAASRARSPSPPRPAATRKRRRQTRGGTTDEAGEAATGGGSP